MQAKEQLLKLLEDAIKEEKYAVCKLLIDAIVDLDTSERTVYYVPLDTEPSISDENIDSYEYIYEN